MRHEKSLKSQPRPPRLPRAGRIPLLVVALSAAFVAGQASADASKGRQVAQTHCARCHEAGTSGAPKLGDKSAWAPRLSRGLDALVLAAIRGHGGMPPRGGKADLTDAELRGAVLYLFDPAGPPKAMAAAPQPTVRAGTQRASVNGLDVYLGRVSAERLRGFPAGSPEARMHGGIPGGGGYHHFSVSVFDATTQAPVTGASVSLDVEQVGMGREPKSLEAVTIAGSTSYGAYVRLAPKASYSYYVRVQKPGSSDPVEAKFQEKLN